jgi:coenzyme F420-reducing hydrogenase gamma subunit
MVDGAKKKIAFFEFTSCEGCQLEFLNQGPELLELLAHVDIVRFREAISDLGDDYEIAVIEGSITTPKQEEQIKDIRSKAKLLVAIGACASSGGVNSLKDIQPVKTLNFFQLLRPKRLAKWLKWTFTFADARR